MMTSTTTAIPLPDAAAWFGSPEWETCIREHGSVEKPEGCAGCAAGLFLGQIREVMFDNGDDVFSEICYLADGYGSVGSMADYDWSGIRDSSPAAIVSMVEFLRGEGLIR